MKTLLRVINVLLCVIGGLTVLGVLFLAILGIAVALLSPSIHRIKDKSVLVFNLDASINDRPTDESSQQLSRLFGSGESSVQLRAATIALREAAQDNRISALYLCGNVRPQNYSSGYAALKELREAIQSFQKSGKPVIAYIENADNRDYYLESVADQILLNPLGLIGFRGLAAQGLFFKDAGDKYGFEFTPIRHGKYKGAVEPFSRDSYSPENREQIGALLKGIWKEMLDASATSRKIAPDELQALVDKEGLITASSAREKGLVTELAYEGDAVNKLRQLIGKTAKDEKLPQVTITEYASEVTQTAKRRESGMKDKIAVVYAEGEIINGSKQADGEVAGDRFARIVRDLRNRKDIKALVLRVNSPGGSGNASEVLLDELRRFNSERPVITSMGTVAASGGYFISMASREILAEPTTITGSIGVFGLALDAKKLANDHGITFDIIKTGEFADLGTIARPMTPPEKNVFQNIVDHFYDEFIQRVAACRKMTTNKVDEVAQGRVWSGEDALKAGLVDKIGNLQQAIEIAAKDAGLGSNYAVVEFPAPKPLGEQIRDALQGSAQPLAGSDAASRAMRMLTTQWRWLMTLNDPHGVYARLPLDLELE